ncbi:8704_t:CDS:2 [Rhizophagus irregularis]|nr:8704_t:CDS:2 [Rhizophagus irregularis]
MPLSDLRNLLDSPNNFNQRNRRRIQRQRRRIINRMYIRRAMVNNTDTLRLIAQLPLQITNNPFENQMFNGTPFY